MDSCHSSISGPNARAPPTPKATAKTASRPTQGQPSDTTAPVVPSAASTARVAPIRTGATAGNVMLLSNEAWEIYGQFQIFDEALEQIYSGKVSASQAMQWAQEKSTFKEERAPAERQPSGQQ